MLCVFVAVLVAAAAGVYFVYMCQAQILWWDGGGGFGKEGGRKGEIGFWFYYLCPTNDVILDH